MKSKLLALVVFAVASAPLFSAPAETGTLARIHERGRLVVGSDMVFPTLNFQDPKSGQNEGFLADLARALAKDLLGDPGKIEFRKTDEKTRLEEVNSGAVDLLIDTIPIGPEKAKVIDFSDETFRSGSALLVPKGSAIKTIDDIKPGTRVAWVTANPDVKFIKAKAPDATYLEFEKSGEAVKALKEGRADVFTQVVTHLFRAASQNPGLVLTGRFTSKPYGIALKKGDAEMRAAVNEFLRKFRASGDYDRLFEKWFGDLGGANVK